MNPAYTIDELDRKILALISKNARIPYLEVARECNVSGAAIHQRIQRLFDHGIITGSEFIIDSKKVVFKVNKLLLLLLLYFLYLYIYYY